jgi:hypothetical protein
MIRDRAAAHEPVRFALLERGTGSPCAFMTIGP